MGQGSAMKMELRRPNDHAVQFLEFVALHPNAIDEGPVHRAEINDQALAVLLHDLGMPFGDDGMGDDNVAARIAPDHQVIFGEVDVLHLELGLKAGAKDQGLPTVAPEGDVVTVVQFAGFDDADAVDESAVGGLIGEFDAVSLDRKLRMHGRYGGMLHDHLAARRIAAHHQACVRNVFALDRELVDNQFEVRPGHDVSELDGHGAARGRIRLLRGGNIRLADNGGGDVAVRQTAVRPARRYRRDRYERLHAKQMLAARAKGNHIVGL